MYEIIKTDFIKYKYLILINANNTLTKNYYTTYKLANEFGANTNPRFSISTNNKDAKIIYVP